jgi:hypothetical protein
MRKLLEFFRQALKVLFPESRIANAVYLVLGYILANWEPLSELIQEVFSLFGA